MIQKLIVLAMSGATAVKITMPEDSKASSSVTAKKHLKKAVLGLLASSANAQCPYYDGTNIIIENTVGTDVAKCYPGSAAQVREIPGDIIVRNNTDLRDFTFFTGDEVPYRPDRIGVRGDIIIENNPELTNLFLGTVNSAKNVIVKNNPKVDLWQDAEAGFGFDLSWLRIAENIEIDNNDNLTGANLRDLRFTQGEGEVSIKNNANLRYVEAPQLTTIAGSLKVDNNDALETVRLAALNQIQGDFEVTNNKVFGARSGHPDNADGIQIAFTDYDIDGDFKIENNEALRSIPIETLQSINGDLIIRNNPGLTNVFFEALKEVTGGIEVDSNDILSSMYMRDITSIGQKFDLTNNPVFRSLYFIANRDKSLMGDVSGNCVDPSCETCQIVYNYLPMDEKFENCGDEQ
jgi:hypothetical protein